MPIKVFDQFIPAATSDTYPLVSSEYVMGGIHHVADLTERDNIPSDRRIRGMLVSVESEGDNLYQLRGGITNSDWVEYTSTLNLDSNYVNVTGDTMTGDLDIQAGLSAETFLLDTEPTFGPGTFTVPSGKMLILLNEFSLPDPSELEIEGDVIFLEDTLPVNAEKIQGIEVDDTNIGNGKVLTYNLYTNNLEYQVPGSTSVYDILVDEGLLELVDSDYQIALNLYSTSDFLTDFGVTVDTDDLSEGLINKYYTDERVDDRVSSLLMEGTGINLTYNDGANTLTINTSWAYNGSDIYYDSGSVAINQTSASYDFDVNGVVSATEYRSELVTLTDASTVTWNSEDGQMAQVTITADRTIAAPTNLKEGTYIIIIRQDGTGGHSVTWGGGYTFTGSGSSPTVDTDPNAVSIFAFVSDGTNIYGKNV